MNQFNDIFVFPIIFNLVFLAKINFKYIAHDSLYLIIPMKYLLKDLKSY